MVMGEKKKKNLFVHVLNKTLNQVKPNIIIQNELLLSYHNKAIIGFVLNLISIITTKIYKHQCCVILLM